MAIFGSCHKNVFFIKKYFIFYRMPNKKKGLRPQETLTAALAAIKAGSSINQPSKRYKIPRTTLGLHYRNQNAVKCLGRKNCFKC